MTYNERQIIQDLSLKIYGTKSGWQGIRDRHNITAAQIIQVLELLNKQLKGEPDEDKV